MAIHTFTNDPAGLLTTIKKLIDAKKIDTWSYDADGDFTHTPAQWKSKAWLRPEVEPGKLQFSIVSNRTVPLTREIFAVYHGRFIEMLIAHVSDRHTHVDATASPVGKDHQIAGTPHDCATTKRAGDFQRSIRRLLPQGSECTAHRLFPSSQPALQRNEQTRAEG
jgi:hypothetical protein